MYKIAVFSLLVIGVYMMNKKDLPRGIRNNNAGNIENNGIAWNGLSDTQNDDRFYQFISAEYGIRAIAKILRTYQSKYGINTVRGIISRWAPPTENNTESYIQAVSKTLGVIPDEPINVDEHMVGLVNSIITHENGYNPYSMGTILDGIALA